MKQVTIERSKVMSGLDSALKPRLKRRSTFEYVSWVLCIL
ncbi:UNVERIFIED_CONTAM: hypothetical protein ABIE34_004145, partial [Jeotgalibacillus campisalis]